MQLIVTLKRFFFERQVTAIISVERLGRNQIIFGMVGLLVDHSILHNTFRPAKSMAGRWYVYWRDPSWGSHESTPKRCVCVTRTVLHAPQPCPLCQAPTRDESNRWSAHTSGEPTISHNNVGLRDPLADEDWGKIHTAQWDYREELKWVEEHPNHDTCHLD